MSAETTTPNVNARGLTPFTLRYDLRSGAASLHEGGFPLAAPFCSGKLPPGTRFDGIRLGASAGAALAVAVDGLHIRAGGADTLMDPDRHQTQY